jgi:hypothetical protein
MNPVARSVLSLIAVSAAAVVLLADSANDCADYGALSARIDYTTDCFGGDTGTITVTKPASPSDPDKDSVTVKSEAGQTLFETSSVVAALACNQTADYPGVAGVAFAIRQTASSAQALVCGPWQVGSAAQTVTCSDSSDAGTSCTLTLTLKP